MELPPFTNENSYEILWKARTFIFEQMIQNMPKNDNLYDLLDEYAAFEVSHSFRVGSIEGEPTETGETPRFLTGDFRIVEKHVPNAAAMVENQIRTEIERMEFIASLIDDDTQAVVELGCGYGLNLFRLSQVMDNETIRYVGAEYTQSGQELCKKLAAVPPAPPIQIEFFDHKHPDLSFLPQFDKILIFTCHSIEQVKLLPDTYFSALAQSAKSVRGVHLEPFGFQLDNSSRNSKKHEALVHSKGWNINFSDCLLKAAQGGIIDVKDVRKDVFTSQSENPSSVAVWESPDGTAPPVR